MTRALFHFDITREFEDHANKIICICRNFIASYTATHFIFSRHEDNKVYIAADIAILKKLLQEFGLEFGLCMVTMMKQTI